MMTKKKTKAVKTINCSLCSYAMPVNATECPNCGAIFDLIQSEEKNSRVMPGPEPAAIITGVGEPEVYEKDELQNNEPTHEISPELADTSVPAPGLMPDQGAIRQSQLGDSLGRNVQEEAVSPPVTEQVLASAQETVLPLPVTVHADSQKHLPLHGFSRVWLFSALLLAGLIFLFPKYIGINNQLRAMSTNYRNTVLAQNKSLGQSESTKSAQKFAILEQQSTISAQQTRIADQIDLDMNLLFGPFDGILIHNNDGLIKTFWADQNTKNFILSVVLVNPYASTLHSWNTSIRFRRNYTDEYRVTIFSAQQWEATFGLSTEPIANGTLTNLRVGDGESNTIFLVVRDEIASFKVNDVLVSYLDLSAYQESGDIGIAIGTRQGNEVYGNRTIIQEFTLWEIP